MVSCHPQLDFVFWPAEEGRILKPPRPEKMGALVSGNGEEASTEKKENKTRTETNTVEENYKH